MTTYPEHWVRLGRDTPIPMPPQVDDEVIPPPDPGTGTLWVQQAHPGVWWAIWQGDSGFVTCEGTEEHVVAWAREQPAAEVNLVAEVSGHDHQAEDEPPPAPEPGTGMVWVMEFQGSWHASWHSDTGFVLFDSEDRGTVLAWAREQPSLGVMISEGGMPHVPL